MLGNSIKHKIYLSILKEQVRKKRQSLYFKMFEKQIGKHSNLFSSSILTSIFNKHLSLFHFENKLVISGKQFGFMNQEPCK